MKMAPRRCTAIKAVLLAVLMAASMSAWAAQVAGTVTNLAGAMMARKANGAIKVLAIKSEVEQGDTLVSEKNTYAQIRFIDNSEITLKPNTTFKVEAFAYEADKPAADAAAFTLVKGGLRSISGLLGKRNKERFALKTPTATIGIRGTVFDVEYIEGAETEEQAVAARSAYLFASTAGPERAAPAAPLQLAQANVPKPKPGPGGLAAGLYVHVIDGLINLSNRGGSMQFSAGQFGFTPSFRTPPVIVPANPGLKFAPPPAFSSSSAAGMGGAPAGGSAAKAIDCEVR